MHRKDMVQMIITILVIVAAFYAVQYFFFPAKPVPVSNEPANAANAPSNTPANTPANNAPANVPAPTTPDKPAPADATADRGFLRLERKAAATHTLANSKLTAVISERGAVLQSLKYVDVDGKPVFLRTPNDPTQEASEPLEIIRPMEHAEFAAPLALRLDDADELRNLSRWELVTGPFKTQDGAQALTFRFPPAAAAPAADGTVVFKTIALYPDSFRLDITLRLENHSGKPVDRTLGLWGAACITNDGVKGGAEHARIALYGSTASKRYTDLFEEPAVAAVKHELDDINEDRVADGRKASSMVGNRELDDVTNPDRFLLAHGLRSQYFVVFLASDPTVRDARWEGDTLPIPEIADAAVSLSAPPVHADAAQNGKPGEARVNMSFYCGPRDKEALAAGWSAKAPPDDELMVEWKDLAPSGWPAVISAPFITLLRVLTNAVGPGFAIILLTLIVRTLLSPLSYRGQKSMAVYTQKMKVVKPQLDKIKEKYAGKKDRDSQLKMLNETRAAMKEQKVGMLPLGGCLPMLVQLPIFIGLYRAFGAAFFLRQAEFLWIHDLSMPDATIPVSFDFTVPIIGFLAHNGIFTINLLPIIWIGLSLVQMKMQPKPDDPQQAAMQKQMGCIFPLMGAFFYAFASGFAFYFIVSSLYSLGESKLIKYNLIKQGVMKAPSKNKPGADEKPKYHAG